LRSGKGGAETLWKTITIGLRAKETGKNVWTNEQKIYLGRGKWEEQWFR